MRSIIKVFILLSIGLALPQASFGLESLQNEIIYRTNLGRADDVALLLKQGADPNGKNNEGVPLLALAASRKDTQSKAVMQALLDAGADIDIRDNSGQSALFYAVKKDNLESVKFLLSKGINYYAIDNNGDIARNIAYKDGHKEVFEALDNFVKQQAEDRNKQYEELNKQIQDRYREQEEAAKKQQEIFDEAVRKQHEQLIEQQKMAQEQLLEQHKQLQLELDEKQKKLEALKKDAAVKSSPAASQVPDVAVPSPASPETAASPVAAPQPPTAEELKKAEEARKAEDAKKAEEIEKAQAEMEKTRLELIKTMGQELSYNNCAFQYWYFCRAIKQSTELSSDELALAIDEPKAAILALEDEMQKELKLKKDYVQRISESAKERIFNELNTMPSKSYRREFGVGKKDDMHTRCTEIARQWDALPPGVEDKDKNNDAFEGGGIGGGAGRKGGSNVAPKPGRAAPKANVSPNQPRGAHKAYGTKPAGAPTQPARRGGAYVQ